MSATESITFLVLTSVSVTYSFAVLRLERLRLALTERKLPNLVGVWTFAAALTLPWHYLTALIMVTYAAEWPARRLVGQNPWRYLYSLAAGIVACLAASAVFHLIGGPPGAILALPMFYGVNLGLVLAAIVKAGHKHVLPMFLKPKTHATELTTQLLGMALAALMAWHLPLTPAVLPVLLLAHRWSLRTVMDQEEAVEQDTGLLAEKTWAVTGQYFLKDNPGAVALIIIDPDEPEIQQDIVDAIRRCLYQPGDTAPAALAPDAPKPATDLLGRYDSRQVAVLIHARSSAGGPLIATNVRRHLRDAGIRAAVGCAVTTGEDLDELVAWALHDLMGRREAAGIATQW